MSDYDSASSASFEDIEPQEPYPAYHEADVAHWNSLVPADAENVDATPEELYGGEVPNVGYVVRHMGLGNRILDQKHSAEPIIPGREQSDKNADSETKKPVLEVVTEIAHVSPFLPRRGRRSDGPPPPYGPNGHRQRGRGPPPPAGMSTPLHRETFMVIHSPFLINALKAVVGYYPDFQSDGKTINITAPYQVLIHHRAELAHYKDNQPAAHDEEYALTTAEHIDVLLGFLERTLGEEIREEESRQQRSIPSATFDNIWMLYKPGEIVYVKHHHLWTPFVISSGYSSHKYQHFGRQLPDRFTVVCWNIASSQNVDSADRSGRIMRNFYVQPFSGEQAIASLDVIPARFFHGDDSLTDPSDVAAKQIRLGKIAWDLANRDPTYMAYDGALAPNAPNNGDSYTGSIGYMSGRVIVDCKGFMKYRYYNPARGAYPPPPHMVRPPPPAEQPRRDHLPYFAPRCRCTTCSALEDEDIAGPFAEFLDRDPNNNTAPKSDLFYLVLSNIVSGFILSDRTWGCFNVEFLNEIKFETDSFISLVLDEEVKGTVKSLVGKFANADGQVSPWPKDFVKNKGMGRIFLLHGTPGVGKTATAEAAAELTQRPLISLTSGDLTISQQTVESSLGHFLKLGERFGAIVLLDEADVYMERRRAVDIARNGLVSVFLRALEYYRGLLFLTTNRVQTVDPAFASRIHVALHYKALTDANREKIWLNSFERLERDSAGKVHVSVATREYAYQSRDIQSLRWNGREIRNALQTAVSLAETESEENGTADLVTVTDKHLRSVVKMSRSFKGYMSRRGVLPEYLDDDENERSDLEDAEDDDQGSVFYDD